MREREIRYGRRGDTDGIERVGTFKLVITRLVPMIPIELAEQCLAYRDGRDEPSHDDVVDHVRANGSRHNMERAAVVAAPTSINSRM